MSEQAEPRQEGTAAAGRSTDGTSDLGRELDREILALLVADSPRRVTDIASSADRHPITVDRTCARLHEHGQIYPVGRGLYAVTEDGKRRIEDCSES